MKYEQIYIDNLCNASKKDIILSWAVEGQGGDGHVNCRNNDYVIKEMSLRGFMLDIELSRFLREKCTSWWLKETIRNSPPMRVSYPPWKPSRPAWGTIAPPGGFLDLRIENKGDKIMPCGKGRKGKKRKGRGKGKR